MDEALKSVVAEVEQHVAREGWDQPVRLFALMRTVDVLASHPDLRLIPDMEYTSLEQEIGSQDIAELLAVIEWDQQVVGAVIAAERIVADSTADASSAPSDRHEVRMVCAALRNGSTASALRYREHDDPALVAFGENIVPQLTDALLASFA